MASPSGVGGVAELVLCDVALLDLGLTTDETAILTLGVSRRVRIDLAMSVQTPLPLWAEPDGILGRYSWLAGCDQAPTGPTSQRCVSSERRWKEVLGWYVGSAS